MKEEVLEQKGRWKRDAAQSPQKGLQFRRYFTREGISPYDAVEWEYRTAAITSESGEVIFEQKNVEVPKTLVDDGHEYRRFEVFSRQEGHAGARVQRAPADRPCGDDDQELGQCKAATSRAVRMPRSFMTNWRICW